MDDARARAAVVALIERVNAEIGIQFDPFELLDVNPQPGDDSGARRIVVVSGRMPVLAHPDEWVTAEEAAQRTPPTLAERVDPSNVERFRGELHALVREKRIAPGIIAGGLRWEQKLPDPPLKADGDDPDTWWSLRCRIELH